VELTRLNSLSNHSGQVFYAGWSKIRTLCHSNICMIWINFRVICPSAFSTKHFYIIQITTKLWQGWIFIKMFRWSWYIDDYIPACVHMSLELQGGQPQLTHWGLSPLFMMKGDTDCAWNSQLYLVIRLVRTKSYLPILGDKLVTAG